MEDDRWPPTSNRRDHPYSDTGYSAGHNAFLLLANLCEPLDEHGYYNMDDGSRNSWHAADGEALTNYAELEWYVRHIRATDEVSVEEMGDFVIKLHALRQALPLTEAERNWIIDPSLGTVDAHEEHIVESIGIHEPELVSAGVRRVVSGRDIMRRWLAWRRETDEYAGQGTLDLAREALRGIVELLLPGELPPSYLTLRRFGDKA